MNVWFCGEHKRLSVLNISGYGNAWVGKLLEEFLIKKSILGRGVEFGDIAYLPKMV